MNDVRCSCLTISLEALSANQPIDCAKVGIDYRNDYPERSLLRTVLFAHIGLLRDGRDETLTHSAHASPASSPVGLRLDIIAGLTAAAVVLPKAMAYATVAGLPVSVGLYTAFVPMIVYALLGTSRVLSVSSTTTLAILVAAQLALVVPDGDPGRLITATATLTALTGSLLIVASVLRLGFVANFISVPVLTGFKAGIGLVIVLDQVPKLLGIHFSKEGFFRDVLSLVRHFPEASVVTLTIGVVALALERVRPHSPAPLAVVAGGIAVSWIAGLGAAGVATVGHIPRPCHRSRCPTSILSCSFCPGRSVSR